MRDIGLQGDIRRKPECTWVSYKALPCPRYRVNRQFQALWPNDLWVADFTYVPPGLVLSTALLASAPMRNGLLASASAVRLGRVLSWMRCYRPFTTSGLLILED